MNREKDSKDGLKLLFDGMPVEKLPYGFNSRLMEHVGTVVQKRVQRREKLGEISLLSIIAVAALTGLFLVLCQFNPSEKSDAVSEAMRITRTISETAASSEAAASAAFSETMSKLSAYFTDIKMPDKPSTTPLAEYINSPLLGISIFVAIAILLLLVLDRFVRKGYASRHSIEL